ncbi:hypothetical protein EDB86DRAFT_3037663 [Lactarius hatsudake]|nr:hypothetical protein EDB86DRAFT_3037663 [Lactarius hatsudake]
MLIPRPRPPWLTLRSLRPLHSSARICDHVAPPDPISNIRPILYDDPVSMTSESLRHPYSLDEFRDDSDTLEYQWKLQRQQLDAFNDNFWRDSNTRFEVAKAAALSGLPPHSTTQQREERLGKFYRNWVLQEATRQQEYNAEWRRRNMEEIALALRVSYHGLKARFMS